VVTKRPTSADVANRAGVSRTTVSFVLNDRDMSISPATRERVLEAARELGYHPHGPARQLAHGRSHTIGLVLLQTPEQIAGDALLTEILRGLATASRGAGYRVLVEAFAPDNGHGTYADLVRSARADGLIVSGPRTDDPDLGSITDAGLPVVIQGSMPGVEVPSVDVDNRAGARVAVEHLVALGHRRIGCITNAPLAYTAADERLAGYQDAMAAAGLEADPAWVEEAQFDAASGHRAMEALLSRTELEAVFVASDVVAFGAIGAIRAAHRRVPHDISIVSFDDIPLAAYHDPPLTTIRLPAYEIGHAAGVALMDRIANRTGAIRTTLPTELIVRASTTSPPATPLSLRA
jgi:LacI family transcriptional regulator